MSIPLIQQKGQKGGRTHLPYAFTEPGIYMLSGMLKSEVAEKVSVSIFKTFVEMKQFTQNNQYMLTTSEQRLFTLENKMEVTHDEVNSVKTSINKMEIQIEEILNVFVPNEAQKDKIFMNGQVFDAYIALADIFKQAKKNITLVDAYADLNTLDYLKEKNDGVTVTIITTTSHRVTRMAFANFNRQYPSAVISVLPSIHDRFILIDYDTPDKKLFQCGTSIKDAGNKISTILRLNEPQFFNVLSTMISTSTSLVF